MRKITTIRQFYDTYTTVYHIRREAVMEGARNNGSIPPERAKRLLDILHEQLRELQTIPCPRGAFSLTLDQDTLIGTDLSPFVTDLAKDIYFLEHSEDEFYSYLSIHVETFLSELLEGVCFAAPLSVRSFLCGIQDLPCLHPVPALSFSTIYSGLFLARFLAGIAGSSAIISGGALPERSTHPSLVVPETMICLASSCGMEYLGPLGTLSHAPLSADEKAKMEQLCKRCNDLITQPRMAKFALLGEGVRYLFDRLLITRQEPTGSISSDEEAQMADEIAQVIADLNRGYRYFELRRTPACFEIVLTAREGLSPRTLSKDTGVRFLDGAVPLSLSAGESLVCGTTAADLPLFDGVAALAKRAHTLFVTGDSSLRETVRTEYPNTFFVSHPDIFYSILNEIGKDHSKKR